MKSSRGSGAHQSLARIHKAKRHFEYSSKGINRDKEVSDDYDFNQHIDKRVHTDFFNNFKDDFDLEDWGK